MIADPITVGNTALARINTGTTVGEFKNSAQGFTLTVSPRFDKKSAYYAIRLTNTKTVVSAETKISSQATAYVNVGFSVPNTGFTAAELATLFADLSAWLTSDTNANMNRVLNGES